MYRVFCQSYENYINQFIGSGKAESRYMTALPLKLLTDPKEFKEQSLNVSTNFKRASDLLFYLQTQTEQYPKLKAFLWTLESRGMTGLEYGISKSEDMEEQTKLINMFLSLLYWHDGC